MAGGTDQSVNLTGMMNQIAKTLGEGYQINGMNAGEALGNNIRELAKPDLDMKDAASIRNYANWAGRNGKDEEALLMQQKAAEVEAQEAQFKGYADAQGHVDAGGKAAREGNEIVYGQSVERLQQQMIKQRENNDFEGWKATQEQLRLLKGQEGTMQTNAVTAKAARVNALADAHDNDPNLQTPEQREILSDTINRMMMEPEVARQVTDTQIQRLQLEKMAIEQRITDETDAFYKDIAGEQDPEKIDAAFSELSGKAQKAAFSMKESMIASNERRTTRLQTATADKTMVFSESYTKELKSAYDHLPEAQRELAHKLIDQAAAEDKSKFVNGTYAGFGGYDQAAIRSKNLSTALNRIDTANAVAIDTTASNKRLETENQMLKAERDSLQPSEQQISNIAKMNDLSREDAIAQAKAENRKIYRELQRQLEPEKYEQFEKGVEAGLNPEWSDEQMDLAMAIVAKTDGGLDGLKAQMEKAALLSPEKREAAIARLWGKIKDAAGKNWPESNTDGADVTDTTPANAIDSNGYVTGGQAGGDSHPAVMAFTSRLRQSNEALLRSFTEPLQAAGGALAEAARPVPMNQNPEVYGNYRQQQ